MKPIDVDVWLRNIAFVCAVLALSYAGWVTHESHILIETNAELARWVTEKIEALEHEISILRKSESEVMQALRTSGSRVADSLLQRGKK